MRPVVIAGQTILIKSVTPEQIKEQIKEGKVTLEDPEDTLSGWFDPVTFTVYVDSKLRADVFRKTVIHELMHASLMLSGITHLLSDKKEEAICTALEGTTSLFEDAEFIKWLNS